MASPSPPKILCAGIAVQDIVMRVENFPAPGTKVVASEFMVTGGGCAANAAVTVARLGGRVGFAGPLGGRDDAISERIVIDLAAECIDCSGCVRVAGGSPSVSLILIDAQGEKAIATRRGGKLSSALPADADTLVADVDAVLIDNRFPDFVTAICQAARRRTIPVVIDLDQATRLDDPLFKLGTHVVASGEALGGIAGTNDPDSGLRALAAHVGGFVAVTHGPDGVYWLDSGTLHHRPAFKVDVIDSLGAGDAFHGALTLALAEGRKIEDALRFASATAALKCTKFGGTTGGAPRRAEVEAFVKNQ